MQRILALCILILLTHPAVHGAPPGDTRAGSVAAQPARSAEESRGAVDRILELTAERIWARSEFYWRQGRWTDRISTDRLVILIDPKFIEAYSALGFLLENTGREEEALSQYLEATRVAPDQWQPFQEVGWYYLQRRQPREAIRWLEQSVAKGEAPPYVWKNLAHAYERDGELEESLATWERVLALEPNDTAIAPNIQRLRRRLREAQGSRERP